ncbi:hypothetical protein [Paraconexibacter sp.]|uniref:hypothetical protein n=1 Tax=Paraconexibacter sp. TaxID=2949640 RepID=UPI00356647AE
MSAHDAPHVLHQTLQELRSHRDALRTHAVAVEPAAGTHDEELEIVLRDLDEEIRHVTEAWVGSAVTEIATLRGQLSSPLHG